MSIEETHRILPPRETKQIFMKVMDTLFFIQKWMYPPNIKLHMAILCVITDPQKEDPNRVCLTVGEYVFD